MPLRLISNLLLRSSQRGVHHVCGVQRVNVVRRKCCLLLHLAYRQLLSNQIYRIVVLCELNFLQNSLDCVSGIHRSVRLNDGKTKLQSYYPKGVIQLMAKPNSQTVFEQSLSHCLISWACVKRLATHSKVNFARYIEA